MEGGLLYAVGFFISDLLKCPTVDSSAWCSATCSCCSLSSACLPGRLHLSRGRSVRRSVAPGESPVPPIRFLLNRSADDVRSAPDDIPGQPFEVEQKGPDGSAVRVLYPAAVPSSIRATLAALWLWLAAQASVRCRDGPPSPVSSTSHCKFDPEDYILPQDDDATRNGWRRC